MIIWFIIWNLFKNENVYNSHINVFLISITVINIFITISNFIKIFFFNKFLEIEPTLILSLFSEYTNLAAIYLSYEIKNCKIEHFNIFDNSILIKTNDDKYKSIVFKKPLIDIFDLMASKKTKNEVVFDLQTYKIIVPYDENFKKYFLEKV